MILSTAVCLNLGPKEIRKRRLFGYLCLNVGLILAIVFVWQDVADWVRLLVFIPFFFGYLGILQAIQKTCVVLAFAGQQNQDQGAEAVVDEAIKRKLKVRSYWILILCFLLASICAYLTLVIHTELLNWPQGPALPR